MYITLKIIVCNFNLLWNDFECFIPFSSTVNTANWYKSSARESGSFFCKQAEDSLSDGLQDSNFFNRFFWLLYVILVWTEQTTRRQRVTVAIHLPSVAESRQFLFRVADGGAAIDFLYDCWNHFLVWRCYKENFQIIRSYSIIRVTLNILGFEEALKYYLNHVSARVESASLVLLPFEV